MDTNKDNKMDTNKDNNEFSTLFKNLGNVVENISKTITSSITNVGDILSKMKHNLDEDQERQIEELMLELSKEDREHIFSIINSKDKLINWWSERCDDMKIVELMVSCSDVFNELCEATNGIENILDDISLASDNSEQNNIFSDLLNKVQNIVEDSESTKTESDDQYKVCFDIAKAFSSQSSEDNNKQSNNKQKNDEHPIDDQLQTSKLDKILNILTTLQNTQKVLEHKIDDISLDIELLVKKI